MATKTHPYTSKLSYSSNGSSYTDLTDMAAITPPNPNRGRTDVTTLESTEAWRERFGSWKDAQGLSARAYFTKAQYNTLLGTLFNANPGAATVYYWKVTFPLITGESTASTLVVQGFVEEISFDEISKDSDDAIMVPFTIAATGKPTFTAGS